jgi:hypothetical protein
LFGDYAVPLVVHIHTHFVQLGRMVRLIHAHRSDLELLGYFGKELVLGIAVEVFDYAVVIKYLELIIRKITVIKS